MFFHAVMECCWACPPPQHALSQHTSAGATSGQAERQFVGQHEALQDSGSSGSCAGGAELAPVGSECSTEPMAAGSCGSAGLEAAELTEHVCEAERGQQPGPACKASADQHPVAVDEPGHEESDALPAVEAGLGLEPELVVQRAAADSEGLSAVASAAESEGLLDPAAAAEVDAVAADEGEEEAAYSLEASAAGSRCAAEAQGPAMMGASQEVMAAQVEPQLADEAEAAAATAEQEAPWLPAAPAGVGMAPHAATAECSTESLVMAVDAEE